MSDEQKPVIPESGGVRSQDEPRSRDWAIESVVNGVPTDRIIECLGGEAAAREWVNAFPHQYRLLSRESAGAWRNEQ